MLKAFILTILTLSLFKFNLLAQNSMTFKSLEECYPLMDSLFGKFAKHDKEEIMNSKSADIMIEYHRTLGAYIRNNWIRGGNLAGIINPGMKYKTSMDGLSMIVLKGYWYYLHGQTYNYLEDLKEEDYYMKSTAEPDRKDYPGNGNLEKLNYTYNVLNEEPHNFVVHIYKAINSEDYYLYIYSWGWEKISSPELLKLKDKATRYTFLKKIYNKELS
jgi:hypothetical protein